jgi:ferritin-like metal-binding protein YciE
MTAKLLNDLFVHTLKDVHFAEHAITKALPKMVKAAHDPALKKAFEKHLAQTNGHIERLDSVFKLIKLKPESVPCEAIKGILKEGDEIVEEFADGPALDAGLIAAAQAVEHYEMARYGALKCWASELGMKDAVSLLNETLEEEKATDAALTKLAESSVNLAAESGTKTSPKRVSA